MGSMRCTGNAAILFEIVLEKMHFDCDHTVHKLNDCYICAVESDKE